jgi:hypothetical protein
MCEASGPGQNGSNGSNGSILPSPICVKGSSTAVALPSRDVASPSSVFLNSNVTQFRPILAGNDVIAPVLQASVGFKVDGDGDGDGDVVKEQEPRIMSDGDVHTDKIWRQVRMFGTKIHDEDEQHAGVLERVVKKRTESDDVAVENSAVNVPRSFGSVGDAAVGGFDVQMAEKYGAWQFEFEFFFSLIVLLCRCVCV